MKENEIINLLNELNDKIDNDIAVNLTEARIYVDFIKKKLKSNDRNFFYTDGISKRLICTYGGVDPLSLISSIMARESSMIEYIIELENKLDSKKLNN